MILGGQHTPFRGGQHAPFWGGQLKPILGGQYERFFQSTEDATQKTAITVSSKSIDTPKHKL